MSKPRVLFICNQPFLTTGNEKTYLSLFQGFENAEVAQLYFNNTYTDTEQFTNYFRITDFDILLNIVTFGIIKIKGKPSNKGTQNSSNKRSTGVNKVPMLFKKIIRNTIRSFFKVTKCENFNDWIEGFKPTVIFFIGSNYTFSYNLLKEISSKYHIPYFIYFTDDYFIYNKGNNYIEHFFHNQFLNKSVPVVEKSEELFVISPKMNSEYRSMFNKNCTILINAVDSKEQNPLKVPSSKIINFRYFGWLHSDRLSSLLYLAESLKFINQNTDYHCKLEIYTLSHQDKIKLNDSLKEIVFIHEPLVGKDYDEKLKTSEFLVHAESFDPAYSSSTRLSISTKIPEYLVSNRCVVAVGPKFLASIAIFEDYNLGICFTEKNNVSENAKKIITILNDDQTYIEYCKKSLTFHQEVFDSIEMRNRLREKLTNISIRSEQVDLNQYLVS
jgi:hypothetical protein